MSIFVIHRTCFYFQSCRPFSKSAFSFDLWVFEVRVNKFNMWMPVHHAHIPIRIQIWKYKGPVFKISSFILVFTNNNSKWNRRSLNLNSTRSFDSCFNLCIRCYFIYGRLLTLNTKYLRLGKLRYVLYFSFELIDKCIMTNTYLDYDKIVLVYCCIVNIYRYHTYARLLPCAITLFVFYQRKITLILSVPYNNFSPSNSLWKSAIA